MRFEQRRHGDVTETSVLQKLPTYAWIKKVLKKSRLRDVSASPVLAMTTGVGTPSASPAAGKTMARWAQPQRGKTG